MLYICEPSVPSTQGRFKIVLLNIVNIFSLFRNSLPLERSVALHLNKLEFPSTKDALCQVLLKLPGGS